MTRALVEPTADASSDRSHHFRTDHLHNNLKLRSVRGGAITLGAQASKFVLQMGSTAILARLLTPADFGIIAMVAAFTGFVGLFKDLGLSMATVQTPDINHEQVTVLFWINVAVSLAMSIACAAMAPAVAWCYGEPRLVWVTVAISATFIFGGLAAQHTALLRRQMRFTALAAIDLISLACGIAAAIALARMGVKYWALVAMTAVQAIIGMLGAWLASGWFPGMPHRGTGVMPMLRFGGNLTGFNLLNYFTRNFDNLLVGALLGAGPLGIYSKAYNLLMMPITQINGPMDAVALPALCRLQGEPIRYRNYYLRALEIITFGGMPLVAFTFVEADSLVLTLLGPQWTAAVPVFRWLAPAAFVGTLNVAPGWLCGSLGHTYRQFRWAMFSAPTAVAAFFIGLKWGVSGVAAAFSITWCILHIIFIVYSCKDTPVRPRDIAHRLWQTAFAAGGAAVVTANLSPSAVSMPLPFARAASSACIFAAAYIGLCLVLPSGRRILTGLYQTTSELLNKVA